MQLLDIVLGDGDLDSSTYLIFKCFDKSVEEDSNE